MAANSAIGVSRMATFQGLRSSSCLSSRNSPCSIRLAAVDRGSHRVSMVATALPSLSFQGESTGEVTLNLREARPETAKAVVHRSVITQLQNRRRGTASTLTRAEVRGGGRKPYKQKGTGRARLGSVRTPLRPGGGVIFGPKPCDWTIKINKKENQLAISTAFQSAAVNSVVIENLESAPMSTPSTKDFNKTLSRWGVDSTTEHALLFTDEDIPSAVSLSARNIKNLKIMTPRSLNIYDVLRADKLLLTQSGIAYLNERYAADEWDSEFIDDSQPSS